MFRTLKNEFLSEKNSICIYEFFSENFKFRLIGILMHTIRERGR